MGMMPYSTGARRYRRLAVVPAARQASPAEAIDRLNHELLTGLTVAIGMAHLLECTDLDDEQRKYVAAVREALDKLPEHAKAALDLARGRRLAPSPGRVVLWPLYPAP